MGIKFVLALAIVLVVLGNLASALPDLKVIEAYTEPDQLTAGQNFQVFVWVRNVGDTVIEKTFWVELLTDGDRRQLRIEDKINPGEERKYYFDDVPSFTEAGSYQIRVKVDSNGMNKNLDNLVQESNEGNNIQVIDVKVKGEKVGDFISMIKGDVKGGGGNPIWLVIGIILVATVVVGIAGLYVIRKRRPKPPKPAAAPIPTVPAKSELEKLEGRKAELEEMIRLAKVKFYKRQIDEESYKGIVKNNQEKLIEVEAKIGEMEGRKKPKAS
jgi:hypothetical protein